MAIIVLNFELTDTAKSGDTGNYTRTYRLQAYSDQVDGLGIRNALTEAEVLRWLVDPEAKWKQSQVAFPTLPPISESIDGLPISDIRFQQTREVGVGGAPPAPEIWDITATYGSGGGGGTGPGGRPEIGVEGVTFSFDISPERGKLLLSLGTVARYPGMDVEDGDIPETNLLINIDDEGKSVEGVEPGNTGSSFALQFTNTKEFFTQDYRAKVLKMRGLVNNAEFFGFQSGEVRFMGAAGQIQSASGSTSTIDFRFNVSVNEKNIDIKGIDASRGVDIFGNKFTNPDDQIAKEGFDYLWRWDRKGEDNGKVGKTPRAAYVERLFYRTDLNELFNTNPFKEPTFF